MSLFFRARAAPPARCCDFERGSDNAARARARRAARACATPGLARRLAARPTARCSRAPGCSRGARAGGRARSARLERLRRAGRGRAVPARAATRSSPRIADRLGARERAARRGPDRSASEIAAGRAPRSALRARAARLRALRGAPARQRRAPPRSSSWCASRRGDGLDFDVQLVLRAEDVPELRLGAARHAPSAGSAGAAGCAERSREDARRDAVVCRAVRRAASTLRRRLRHESRPALADRHALNDTAAARSKAPRGCASRAPTTRSSSSTGCASCSRTGAATCRASCATSRSSPTASLRDLEPRARPAEVGQQPPARALADDRAARARGLGAVARSTSQQARVRSGALLLAALSDARLRRRLIDIARRRCRNVNVEALQQRVPRDRRRLVRGRSEGAAIGRRGRARARRAAARRARGSQDTRRSTSSPSTSPRDAQRGQDRSRCSAATSRSARSSTS